LTRLVGGLLAGHLATGRPRLLERCADLAERLLPAYRASPHAIPYTHVNLRTGEVDRGARVTPLAEAGAGLMEFGLLSRLTGDERYLEAPLRACEAVLARRSSLGLLGSALDAETGEWSATASVAPNPPAGAFLAGLWGGYALLGEPLRPLRDWFVLLADAVARYQADTGTGRLWFRTVGYADGEQPAYGAYRQAAPAASYAGLLGASGRFEQGADYYRSWTDWLDRYPVLPQEIDYRSREVSGPGDALLPGYAGSAFELWRLGSPDQQEYYRRTAYQFFDGMRANQRVPGGYTVAQDVTVHPMRLGDAVPGHWFCASLKYLYLMFADCRRFDYRDGLLSTGGKVLRGLIRV
jgi:mannosyl-oligosaccharide alpha-1,2-mannosidase